MPGGATLGEKTDGLPVSGMRVSKGNKPAASLERQRHHHPAFQPSGIQGCLFFHVGFLEGLFANVEERLGLSIEHLAFEAQRNASRAVFEVFYSRMPGGHLVRKFRAGKRMNLEATQRLMELLGNPHEQVTAVHIAGTKGKGSVAAMVEATCRAAGYRTGLFTSPHLVSWRERIRIDGRDVAGGRVDPSGQR